MTIVPGPGQHPEDDDALQGEVIDGGAPRTQSEDAAIELAGVARLAAAVLYTPGRVLGVIADVIGLILLALTLTSFDGSSFISIVSAGVAIVLIASGLYLVVIGSAARSAAADQDRLAGAFTSALQQRRSEPDGMAFERALMGEASPLLGGARVRDPRILLRALGQLPGRWRSYPELRPFIKPTTTISIRASVAAGIGIPLGIVLIIITGIASLLG